jgi:hypothetical protein
VDEEIKEAAVITIPHGFLADDVCIELVLMDLVR